MSSEKSRVFVIFTSSGLDHRGAWEPAEMHQHVLSNTMLLHEIEMQAPEIEFVGKTELLEEERKARISLAHYHTTDEEKRYQAETQALIQRRRAQVVRQVQDLRDELAGILIFGAPWKELIQLGLPTVAVFTMWGTWMANFDFSAFAQERILTSWLPVVRDASKEVFAARIQDIARKLHLLHAIHRMKGLRALVITDEPILGAFEPGYGDKKEYERIFMENLQETLGSELITIPQEELYKRLPLVNQKEAQKISQKWIRESAGMRDTNEEEVFKSAQLYLAMGELMEQYNCQAITTEGYGVFAQYPKGPIPSQGLPSSQFYTDGVIATSECLINSLLTQQLGLYVTGRPSFNGDYLIDPFHDVAIVGHCECPFNPYGDERRSPYIIRNLPRWKKYEGGACVQVELPLLETVTVTRLSMHDKKLCLFTGETIPGRALFAEWDDLACRTKLAIRTNAQALLRNLDWRTFGNHRVVFYGDYRQDMKDLAVLLGFGVVEEDL